MQRETTAFAGPCDLSFSPRSKKADYQQYKNTNWNEEKYVI